MGLLHVDLSEFFSYCKASFNCNYNFYESKYDGLALGHYLSFFETDILLTKITTKTIFFEFYHILCNAVTQNCWGWNLIANNYPQTGYVVSSCFGSGYDKFDLSTYEPINVNFYTTHLKFVSNTEKVYNYGFDPTYWMANDHQVGWPQ